MSQPVEWPRNHEGVVDPAFSDMIATAERLADGGRMPLYSLNYSGLVSPAVMQPDALAHLTTGIGGVFEPGTESFTAVGDVREQFGLAMRQSGLVMALMSEAAIRRSLREAEEQDLPGGARGVIRSMACMLEGTRPVNLAVISDEAALTLPAGIVAIGPLHGKMTNVWVDRQKGRSTGEVADWTRPIDCRRIKTPRIAQGHVAAFRREFALARPLRTVVDFEEYLV